MTVRDRIKILQICICSAAPGTTADIFQRLKNFSEKILLWKGALYINVWIWYFCIATLRRGQRQGGWCDLCSDQVGGWREPRSNQGSRSHDWVRTRERFLKQGVIWTKNNVGQSTIAEIMPKSGTTLQPGILPRRDLISEIWGISELLPDLWSAWSARRGTRPVWRDKFEVEIVDGLFIM